MKATCVSVLLFRITHMPLRPSNMTLRQHTTASALPQAGLRGINGVSLLGSPSLFRRLLRFSDPFKKDQSICTMENSEKYFVLALLALLCLSIAGIASKLHLGGGS